MFVVRKALLVTTLSAFFLSGCVSQVAEKSQYSGYLSSYDGLSETTTNSGAKVLRWIAPGFDPKAYSKIVFEHLDFYPKPEPSDRVDEATLMELQILTSDNAKSVLSRTHQVVPGLAYVRKGERALIMHAAITSVSASNVGMKWYEVIPIAAAVGTVQAITGYRDQNTLLYIEADLVDANTGETVVKTVRKVFGEKLKNNKQRITTDDFMPAMQTMTGDMQELLR